MSIVWSRKGGRHRIVVSRYFQGDYAGEDAGFDVLMVRNIELYYGDTPEPGMSGRMPKGCAADSRQQLKGQYNDTDNPMIKRSYCVR